MIGVFDSGEGGENAVRHIRAFAPDADIMLFADRENSPYGTKRRDELVRLTEAGIERLAKAGCERILIACCTASTVHGEIERELSEVSLPIIAPTAREAERITRSGKIALLATDATVQSHAFSALLGRACPEIAASPLVCAIERGERDGHLSEACAKYLDALLSPIADTDSDTVILGCTHFVCLRREIESRLQKLTKRKIYTVDSSEVAARYILDIWPRARIGEGRLQRL